jgi:hypothetical protein
MWETRDLVPLQTPFLQKKYATNTSSLTPSYAEKAKTPQHNNAKQQLRFIHCCYTENLRAYSKKIFLSPTKIPTPFTLLKAMLRNPRLLRPFEPRSPSFLGKLRG